MAKKKQTTTTRRFVDRKHKDKPEKEEVVRVGVDYPVTRYEVVAYAVNTGKIPSVASIIKKALDVVATQYQDDYAKQVAG